MHVDVPAAVTGRDHRYRGPKIFPAHAEGTPAPGTAQALYGGTTRGVQVASDPRADACQERLDGVPRFSEGSIQYKDAGDGRQECVLRTLRAI
jgi:hypothetical protein